MVTVVNTAHRPATHDAWEGSLSLSLSLSLPLSLSFSFPRSLPLSLSTTREKALVSSDSSALSPHW